jgi:hypothetical protein
MADRDSRDHRPLDESDMARRPDEDSAAFGLIALIAIATVITLGAIFFLAYPREQRVVGIEPSAKTVVPVKPVPSPQQ